MKRPALTRKAIRNLESLADFADGEIGSYEDDGQSLECTQSARAAMEWIKRLRQWKTQQDKKKKEAA